jgi:hypothetical protein
MKIFHSLIIRFRESSIYLKIILAVFLGALILGISLGASSSPPKQQPISFDHKSMVSKGVSCLFCHSGAMRSETAGIPSLQKCMGCHKTNDKNNPEIAKLIDYSNQQKPIEWVRINTLPRFVHFSHEVHVAGGGINCENCHGDVGQMTVYQQVNRINMGWCLDCHKKQPNAQALYSCETCHQ